jgi:FkbM family methyltransferase
MDSRTHYFPTARPGPRRHSRCALNVIHSTSTNIMTMVADYVLSLSRKVQFMGKARLLDLFGLGPSNRDLVPANVNSVECLENIVIQTSRNSDIMFRELYVNGSYQGDVLIALRNLLRGGKVLWDVGANYGLMSIYAACHFRGQVQVIAFEPSPIVLKELRNNLELNRCENVTVEPICLGDRDGTVPFFVSEDQSWNATMIPQFAQSHAENLKIEVPCSTIALCVERLPPPDVIKLDVEGAEHLVVRGGRRFLADAKTSMIVEYNVHAIRDAGLTPRGYLDLFRDLGYTIHAMKRPVVGPFRWETLQKIQHERTLPVLCNLIMLKSG